MLAIIFSIDDSKKQSSNRKSAKGKQLLKIIIPKTLFTHGHFIS